MLFIGALIFAVMLIVTGAESSRKQEQRKQQWHDENSDWVDGYR